MALKNDIPPKHWEQSIKRLQNRMRFPIIISGEHPSLMFLLLPFLEKVHYPQQVSPSPTYFLE